MVIKHGRDLYKTNDIKRISDARLIVGRKTSAVAVEGSASELTAGTSGSEAADGLAISSLKTTIIGLHLASTSPSVLSPKLSTLWVSLGTGANKEAAVRCSSSQEAVSKGYSYSDDSLRKSVLSWSGTNMTSLSTRRSLKNIIIGAWKNSRHQTKPTS